MPGLSANREEFLVKRSNNDRAPDRGQTLSFLETTSRKSSAFNTHKRARTRTPTYAQSGRGTPGLPRDVLVTLARATSRASGSVRAERMHARVPWRVRADSRDGKRSLQRHSMNSSKHLRNSPSPSLPPSLRPSLSVRPPPPSGRLRGNDLSRLGGPAAIATTAE